MIRKLQSDDIAIYRDLRLTALRESPDAFGTTLAEEAARSMQEWRHQLTQPDGFVLGAFGPGEELIGAVGCQRGQRLKERHKATLREMYVVPWVRGRGVGRVLLSHAIREARRWPGLEQIQLALVVGNPAARIMYIGAGFQPFGLERQAGRLEGSYYDLEYLALRLGQASTRSSAAPGTQRGSPAA